MKRTKTVSSADKWSDDLLPGEMFVGADGETYVVPSKRLLEELAAMEKEPACETYSSVEDFMKSLEEDCEADNEEDDDVRTPASIVFDGCETVGECLERLRALPTIDWDYLLLVFAPVYHKCEPPETGYWVEIPDFPGCVSKGETIEETRAMIREAAQSWVETYFEVCLRHRP